MSQNRLFVYDPVINAAACIAKGYTNGWACGDGPSAPLQALFATMEAESEHEWTGEIQATRLQLRTEIDVPKDARFFWFDGDRIYVVRNGERVA